MACQVLRHSSTSMWQVGVGAGRGEPAVPLLCFACASLRSKRCSVARVSTCGVRITENGGISTKNSPKLRPTHGPQAPTARLAKCGSMSRVRGDDELMELLGMMGGGDPSAGKVAGSQDEEGVRCARGYDSIRRKCQLLTVPRPIS